MSAPEQPRRVLSTPGVKRDPRAFATLYAVHLVGPGGLGEVVEVWAHTEEGAERCALDACPFGWRVEVVHALTRPQV